MLENFINVGESTLAAAALAGDTSFTLLSGAPFNVTGQFRIRLDDSLQQVSGVATRYEICRASFNGANIINAFRTGNDLEGTVAQAWPIGTRVASVITAGGLNTALAGQYKARARNTYSTPVTPANVVVKIALTSVDYDPNGNFASSRYTVPVSGFYLVTGRIRYVGIADGWTLDALIFKNGSLLEWSSTVNGAISSPTAIVSDVFQLAAGDYIELFGQSSGGTVQTWNDVNRYSTLTIHCLST